jgi:hypothetical protein
MAKKVRVSSDGVTYYTLPGDKADLSNDTGQIRDTAFGQDYQSNQPGLIVGALTFNGLYKGFAGYVAKIKKSGSTTAMTAEPMALVSGKTYQVTNAAKRMFDRSVAPVFKDATVAIAATNILNIDYLYGRVTFISSYTPGGAVTVDGSYLTLTQIAKGQSFTLNQTAATIDVTDYETAQANAGHRAYDYGLKTVSLEISGVYASSNAYRALVEGRGEMIVEIGPDGNNLSVARGFFKPSRQSQSGDVGALEEEKLGCDLSVPDDPNGVLAYPFAWLHANTSTLNAGIQAILAAWQNKTLLYARYLPDGTNGVVGQGVVTDTTLSGGLEVMNTFACKMAISGQLVAYP